MSTGISSVSLPICRPVVLKTLAAICIAHESPPLIRSELVLDSRWAEMCCTSQTLPKDCGCSLPQNPNAINYLGSQRIVTCFKDRGLQCQFSQTCEGCEWLLLGFFFWLVSWSFEPSLPSLYFITCNGRTTQPQVRHPQASSTLSSHSTSWHVVLGLTGQQVWGQALHVLHVGAQIEERRVQSSHVEPVNIPSNLSGGLATKRGVHLGEAHALFGSP